MQPDNAFHRAFHHACDSGDISDTKEAIATGRLAAGTRVTIETTHSLPGADGQQDPRIVRLFLDRGVGPNATHSELIMRLKRSTSSTPPSLRPSDGEPDLPNPPLGRAIISAQEPDTSLLELYIAYGARLKPNLLLYAVRPRVPQSEVMTRFLLDRGLNPNVASDDEWGTPLPCAAANGKVNLVKMLLEAGADPTVIPSSSTKFGRVTPARAAKNRVRHQETLEEILHLLESYSCQESRQPS
ncbi:hypothetical protein BDV09DRAFT_204787 [Aspergillus tetrazonus]